jgi:hypothetical protein
MKDLVISKKRIKTELIIWLCCFSAAFLMNIYAIIKYNNSWLELITQLHIVVLLSLVIYLLYGSIRIIIWSIKVLIKKK